ncbi:type IV secretion system protein [Paenibacillus fonticola]|uniref:type IV secretion system protein n=1 Tax=Paenibacillus fonticola TaxID=379896 RepID=UPI0003754D66|nr:type IV secretion system protein [Paenibacillus fonticola]
MTDAILEVLKWINDMLLGMATEGSDLTGTLNAFMPELYKYCVTIMDNVVKPVAYTVLALFFVLELYKASIRTDGMGGSANNLGAEIVFRVLFRMVLCKLAVDSVSLILNAIYDATTHLTTGIAGVVGSSTPSGGIDLAAIEPMIDELGFWKQLVTLIICMIIFLVVLVAVTISYIIIVARFIELYVYFTISPIPLATLPNEEMSQIGKSFLKSFAAVCLQGTLIFLVLSFLPAIFNAMASGADNYANLWGSLIGVLGYAIVLIIAIMSTGRWAKAISNAM